MPSPVSRSADSKRLPGVGRAAAAARCTNTIIIVLVRLNNITISMN